MDIKEGICKKTLTDSIPFLEGGASADRKKASPLPFPPSHIVSHSQTNKSSLLETRTKNPADEPGYGSGFHDLSDIIAHILQNKNRWFTKKSNVSKTLTDIMSADGSYLNSSRVSDAVSSQSHKRKDWATRKNNAGNKEKKFPANIVTSTYSNIQSSENYGSKRTALVIDNDVDSRNWNSTPRSNHTNHKQNTQDFLSKVDPYLKNDQSNHAFSGTTDKTGNIPRVRPRNLTSQGEVFHVGPQGKVARLANFTGRHSRFPPSALRSKKNMAVKLRNLRRQLARLKLKLNKYIHSAHIGTKKKVKHNTLNILGKVRKAPLNFSSS